MAKVKTARQEYKSLRRAASNTLAELVLHAALPCTTHVVTTLCRMATAGVSHKQAAVAGDELIRLWYLAHQRKIMEGAFEGIEIVADAAMQWEIISVDDDGEVTWWP